MSLIKLNDRAVKDVTQFGSISSLGSLTHISTATASASASIEFTSGIDSTYKEYVFYFVNIHSSGRNTDGKFQFNVSIDGGSNYNVAKTTTFFSTYHGEDGADGELAYRTGDDLAQGTGFQNLTNNGENTNDANLAGTLRLFNPSSTTFVKHFISTVNTMHSQPANVNSFIAGYANTTSAVDAVQFKFISGTIDAGQILLFGVN